MQYIAAQLCLFQYISFFSFQAVEQLTWYCIAYCCGRIIDYDLGQIIVKQTKQLKGHDGQGARMLQRQSTHVAV